MNVVGHMKGLPEYLITYQPRQYPGELNNIPVYHLNLRLKNALKQLHSKMSNCTCYLIEKTCQYI